MKKSRDTSIHLVIALIFDLLNGTHLRLGDDIIAMSEEGHIGYVLQNDKGERIAGDISVKGLAELVERHEVIKIPPINISGVG